MTNKNNNTVIIYNNVITVPSGSPDGQMMPNASAVIDLLLSRPAIPRIPMARARYRQPVHLHEGCEWPKARCFRQRHHEMDQDHLTVWQIHARHPDGFARPHHVEVVKDRATEVENGVDPLAAGNQSGSLGVWESGIPEQWVYHFECPSPWRRPSKHVGP